MAPFFYHISRGRSSRLFLFSEMGEGRTVGVGKGLDNKKNLLSIDYLQMLNLLLLTLVNVE